MAKGNPYYNECKKCGHLRGHHINGECYECHCKSKSFMTSSLLLTHKSRQRRDRRMNKVKYDGKVFQVK